MKYAHEVIDLMASYPGRAFRLMELVRHISHGRELTPTEKTRLQRGVQRAMEALEECGSVNIREPEEGRHGRAYQWRVTNSSQSAPISGTSSVTIAAG